MVQLKLVYSKRITVGASTLLSTLASYVFGAAGTVANNVYALKLIPEAATPEIRMAYGAAATASTEQLPSYGELIYIDAAKANTLYLYSASTAYAKVEVYTQR